MILNFDDEFGARHFEFCFVGFVLGGSLQQTKGMNVLRTEVALFEKLESISDLKPCGKKMVNGEPERALKAGTAKISVTPQEFDLLYNYLVQTPWQSGSPARYAVETIDWLASENRRA